MPVLLGLLARTLLPRTRTRLRLPDLDDEEDLVARIFLRLLGLRILLLETEADDVEEEENRDVDLSGGTLGSERIGFATPTYKPEWDQGYEADD